MKILALECSTVCGSIAITENTHLIAEESWTDSRKPSDHIFRALPTLLDKAKTKISDIDIFAAGRGPGMYSGIRVAITTATSLAMPGSNQVFCISSGEALAYEVAQSYKSPLIAVVGDARREKLWYGLYECSNNRLITKKTWSLTDFSELRNILPPDTLIVSPNWERLEHSMHAFVKYVFF